jgi:hypothetical protein
MDHTYAAIEPARDDGLAEGHRYVFGLPIAWDEPYPTAIVPAGYQISSAADMGRYLAAMSNHGLYHGVDVVGRTTGMRDYGIDWVPVSGVGPGFTPGHSGATLNTNAGISYAPVLHLGVVVLTNANPTELWIGTPRGAQEIAFDLLRFSLGQPAMTSGPTVREAYLVADAALLVAVALLAVHALRLRGWRARISASRRPSLALLPSVILDGVLPLAILVGLPLLVGMIGVAPPFDIVGTWAVAMWTLPDIAASLIVASAALLLVGAVKVIRLRRPRSELKASGALVGAALVACAALISACSSTGASPSPLAGSGPVKTEVRPVGEFTFLEIRHGIKLELAIGTPASVEVAAPENLLPITLTSVATSRLTVDASRDYVSSDGITVRITVPALSELVLSGGASGAVSGLVATEFRLRTEGTGEIRISGSAKRVAVFTRGGGVIDLGELAAEEASVDLAGGAKVTLRASRSVTGTAVGGVALMVKGNPATLTVEATGGAAVLRQ